MNILQSIRDSAKGQWIGLFQTIGGISPTILDGNHHPCPKCGGKDRFRLLDIDVGALYCNKCFNTKNGDGVAAIQWLTGWDFKTTITKLTQSLGIKRKRGPELSFIDWNDELVRLWALKKKGILPAALPANGARLARWRDIYTVISIPILALNGKPAGYVSYNITGGPITRPDGEQIKIMVSSGAKPGWVGAFALNRIANPNIEVVWKVEGISDMLALWSVIPDDQKETHLVITNPFGSEQNPERNHNLLDIFRDKSIIVCHDLDEAGEVGGRRWAESIAAAARECRLFKLPLPPLQGPGTWKDIRDFINAGHGYSDLIGPALATPLLPQQPGGESHGGNDIDEANNDPARLAREFIKTKDGKIAYYREDFYYWVDGRWQIASSGDVRADFINWMQGEFRRIYLEEKALSARSAAGPSQVIRTTEGLTSSSLAALRAFSAIPSRVDWGMELEREAGPAAGGPDSGRAIGGRRQRWIAMDNGILMLPELLQGESEYLKDHSPNWFSPHKLRYAFDPIATMDKCPCWREFLGRNLEGDVERISFLQEWVGYCLLPCTDFQKFLIIEGEGANGKSVFCAVIEALLGPENVSHVPLELFGTRFALYPTLGKLANIITEVGDLDKIQEGYLKAYTDGSAMTFDRKGKEQIESRPTARLIIATNNRPRFSDRSAALWRRMVLIPWNIQIPEGERVIGMDKPDWWYESGEMPAVFNWAIDGLQRLELRGYFTTPEVSREAIEDYRIETNPAREYLLDNFEIAEEEETAVSLVYKGYVKFCETNGYRALGSRTFGKEVRRIYPTVEKFRYGPRDDRSWRYRGLAARTVIPHDL